MLGFWGAQPQRTTLWFKEDRHTFPSLPRVYLKPEETLSTALPKPYMEPFLKLNAEA